MLTKTQETIISLLSHSSLSEKFYWTGGTALAYHYLRHRKSLDLDFFSEKRFDFNEVNAFMQTLKQIVDFKKINYQKIFDRYEFLCENSESLRIEFVYYNDEKKTLKKREKILGIYIDSLEDIAANKTMAFFDRNEPKDLFDVYFLVIKGRFAPEKLLSLAKQKFGVTFALSSFWSEAFKSLPLLSELKPLLLEENVERQEQLLKEINNYFKKNSADFLNNLVK